MRHMNDATSIILDFFRTLRSFSLRRATPARYSIDIFAQVDYILTRGGVISPRGGFGFLELSTETDPAEPHSS